MQFSIAGHGWRRVRQGDEYFQKRFLTNGEVIVESSYTVITIFPLRPTNRRLVALHRDQTSRVPQSTTTGTRPLPHP